MKQPVDYKQKYTEVRKELTQLKKIVQKQDQYIVNLLDRIAELNKNSMRVEGAAIEKEKEKTRLLAKELRNTKKELKEKTKTIERLTRLSFENGFGLVGAREAIKKLNEQRNTDLRPLKRKLEPVIDPTPKVAPSQQPRPQRYVSDYVSALLDCGVDALHLRPDLTTSLEEGGIETVYMLVTTPKSKLKSLDGIGPARVQKIRQTIKPMGLDLEMQVKYIPESRKYIKL